MYDFLNVIVAIVVVYEPTLDADSGVIRDPLTEEACLVADHGAYAHLVFLFCPWWGYNQGAGDRGQCEVFGFNGY